MSTANHFSSTGSVAAASDEEEEEEVTVVSIAAPNIEFEYFRWPRDATIDTGDCGGAFALPSVARIRDAVARE